ncbi:GntR family transcriptional regulator [Pelagibius sp. CAU 1746]|uniref:GntR family transcriptional regulator n=1 Tax=Pelagibius sp. CAU 1746 TaxID=3140370 RepID=UPI00325A78CA
MSMTQLDRSSPVPLFLQIRQALIAEIRSWSDLEARFPSDLELAERFGVSKMTVRQAIDDLVGAGLLVRHRGRGTFVTESAYVERLSPSLDIDQQYALSGVQPETRVLGFEVQPAGAEEKAALSDPQLEAVLKIRRVRSANGVPVALDERLIPEDIAVQAGFDPAVASGSIVGRLRERIGLSKAQWRMSALTADKDFALVLCIQESDPVLERAMVYLDKEGRPVLSGRTWHRGDLVSCAFELPLDPSVPDDLVEMRRS